MSYCLNPNCQKPQNPKEAKFCQACGLRLLLGDRYRAFNPLGSGTTSRTFLALDTRKLLDPRCIIKQFTMGDRAEAFRREVAQLDQVSQHSQIPDLFAYFERSPHQYIVQECIDGQTLLQQLTEAGTFDETQIRQLLQEILPLLQFLHDRHLLHRDIKPSNLIRRHRDRCLMLVDFGAAKHLTKSALARTGTVLGSAEYAAPEQLMGQAIVPSDLFSLAVTCIQLLTGLRPFALFNSSDGTWIWRSVAAAVSDSLAQVLDKLLQNRAGDRYPSANAVMQALNLTTSASAPSLVLAAKPVPRIWHCTQTLPVGMAVTAIALIPARRLVVAGADPVLQIWDLDRLERCLIAGHTQTIAAVAVSQDGQILASGSRDHTIKLWDAATGHLRQTLVGHTDTVTALVISPDGILISGSRDHQIKLWQLQTGQLLGTLTEQRGVVESIALGHGYVASGSTEGIVKIWHLGTKELLRSLPEHPASVRAIGIAQDSIITASWDMTLKLHHLHTGGLRHTLTGHLLPVATIAIGTDGQTLATGSHDRSIRLWHLETGQPLGVVGVHTEAVEAIAFLDEANLVSGSQDGTIKLWQQK